VSMLAKIAVMAVVLMLVVGYLLVLRRGDLSSSEARALVASGALLVDVRSPGEFAAGHIDGAVNVPVDQISNLLERLGSMDRTVIVYCRSGARSSRSARVLREAGFEKVRDLGAMARW
jgi:phage shock protein E